MSDKKKYILIGVGVVVLIALFSNIGKKEETTTQEEHKELILKAAPVAEIPATDELEAGA